MLSNEHIRSANKGLLKIYRNVLTSKPKQPGDVPAFIVYNAVASSVTVKGAPNKSESVILPEKLSQKSSGRGTAC